MIAIPTSSGNRVVEIAKRKLQQDDPEEEIHIEVEEKWRYYARPLDRST